MKEFVVVIEVSVAITASNQAQADWAELLRAELGVASAVAGEEDELMAEELEHYDEQEINP